MNKLFPPIIILAVTVSFNTSLAQEKFTKKVVKIGVTQSVSNSKFDADAKGFEKALAEAGFKEGTGLIYQRENAKRNGVDAEKIAQRFLDDKVDLVHSIAPLASQAAVKKIRHLPIVFSSVTDPVNDGLVPKRSLPGTRSGTNVTGTSDRWPVQAQFEMYVRFFPKAKKWGTIFNAGDSRSILHIQEMRATAKRLVIELFEATASSKSDILNAAQALAGKVQAMIITFDSTVLSSFDVVVKVCNEKKIPLFVGDLDKVSQGAVAAYGSNYFDVGYFAGKKAVRILKGERPGEIPWGPVEKLTLVVNEKAAKAQGVVIPAGFLKKADRVIRD